MSQLKKNFIYNALLTTSGFVLPFITFPYVTRVLAPEGIGQVNFVNSFIQYFVIISSLGIPFYGVREIAKCRENLELRSKLLFELFILKLIFSFISLVIYLAIIFSVPRFYNYLSYYTFGIALIVIGTLDFNYFFSGLENFKYITVRTVFFQVVSVILTFIFIQTRTDTLKYFLIPIFISLLTVIVNTRYILKFVDVQALKKKLELKKHIKPLVLLFSIMLFSSIYNLLDTTILGFITNDKYVGYYSAATKINKIPISLLMVLVPVMLPRVSNEFEKKNYIEIKRLVSKTIHFVILLGVPITMGLLAISPEIISLFSGAEFTPSITTLRILSPLAFIIGLTTNFSTQLLVPLGKDRQLLISVVIGTVVSILLNIILIPVLYQNGAAISNLAAEIVVLSTCYYFVSKFVEIYIPFKEIVLTFIACLPFWGIAFIVRCIFVSPLFILVITVLISGCYYFAVQNIFLKNIMVTELKSAVQRRFLELLPIKSR
ncbi:MAG: flippase [Solirubrobacterales bacterium]